MQRVSEALQVTPTTGFPLTVKDLLLSGTPEPVSFHWGVKLGKRDRAEKGESRLLSADKADDRNSVRPGCDPVYPPDHPGAEKC